ncbi:ABC-2 type transport system ATP-binding protein [Thermosipho japonicus]|uniref:ABC-2 type transport system ATP-binding protein n=1 Tax=Thermosipho japonicus TaxID=90323 RepID=A0A841GEU4_9BACT|nr:ABC transporter ATP-binding protein [Thermosipho japonicus]MBB6062082.1 ABC-2 type transport system ATP-binding protein [Thermosipho japonicus]
MIELFSVSKRYKKDWVVKDISFSALDGEVIGIIGRNGCGKSTILKMVAGIIKPTKGKIKLNSNLISYIPEKPVLIPELTLEENIGYFASIRNVSKEKIDKEIEYFQLSSHLKKRPMELSKGLQQRLSMAIALLIDPDIVLLDEPTSGLDAESKKLILNRIKELKMNKKTILYVTHDDEEIENICDKVLILNKGVKVFFGSVEDFWMKYERFVYVTLAKDKATKLVRIEDLKNFEDIVHIRSVGIREYLGGLENEK